MKILWSLIALVLIGLAGTALWVNAVIDQPASQAVRQGETPPAAVIFNVQKGDGVKVIAGHLAQQKLISSPLAWTLYIVASGLRADLLPGQYNVNASMTGRQIASLLTTDQNKAKEVTVKILEGLTAKQIAAQLDKAGVISSADFLAAVDSRDSRTLIPDRYYEFLTDKPTTANLEGFLFPDTYKFFQHSSQAVVLKKFLDNFDAKFKSPTRQAVKASGRTYYQNVIMASILEAELKTDADRAMAADIFWRRNAAGIALQSDTTVIYALGGGKTTLTNADLQVDSLYNTYKYRGLPPGPINNPGLSALRAAAFPTANDYWYYLTGSDGKTYYAKTLDEHNRNKQLYLK